MRIGLFTDSELLAGTERHILDLAKALRAENLEPVVICPGNGVLAGLVRSAGLCVLDVSKSDGIDWRAVKAVWRELRSGNIDVIHAHNGRTAMIAAMAVTLAGRGKIVVTQHFITPSRVGRRGIKGLLANAVHRWVERRVSGFIAISEAVKEAMVRRGDAAVEKIGVIHNGILAPVLDHRADPADLRRELGAGPDRFLIACAARLELEKDLGSLVEAMATVRESHPRALCLIAGDGSQRADLEDRIKTLGLEGNVRLLGFRNDVLAVVEAADVFVLPSLAEPFGLALLEAMALGKPVVATAAGGPVEMVANGQTGFLVPPSNPSELGAAIARFAADAPLRVRMGQAGYQRFVQRFTAGRMAAQTAALYRDVASNEWTGPRSPSSDVEIHTAPLQASSNANG